METLDPASVDAALALVAEPPLPPRRVTRLDRGYSWRSYRVSGADDRVVILRIAPQGGTMEPYDPAAEARAIASGGESVPAPTVLAVEPTGQILGVPFAIHDALEGTVVRPSSDVPSGERPAYRRAFAETLGRLHARPSAVVTTVEQAYREELEVSLGHYRRSVFAPHPGFEIGYRWLLGNIPAAAERAVQCHGDFRLTNLLWSAPGELTGVLDWERSWTGDPMADVAFSRLFSGWCAVDGDAVPVYESASGLVVDEERVGFATRFERWRSFTSSMRGLRALVDGRNDDRRLLGIGLAGDAGAWSLVDWLEPGLPSGVDGPPVLSAPAVPPSWLETGVAPLASRLEAADRRAVVASLDALRPEADVVPSLAAALAGGDASAAWDRAFVVLAAAARIGGPELIPALKALALRATLRPALREEAEWR